MVTGHRLWWHRGRRDVGVAAGAATPWGRGHGKHHVGTSRGPRRVTLAPRRAGGEDLVPTPQGQRGEHNCGPAGGGTHASMSCSGARGAEHRAHWVAAQALCLCPRSPGGFPVVTVPSVCGRRSHVDLRSRSWWHAGLWPAPSASHAAWWHVGTCASFGVCLFTSSSHHQPAGMTPLHQEAQNTYLDNSLLRT